MPLEKYRSLNIFFRKLRSMLCPLPHGLRMTVGLSWLLRCPALLPEGRAAWVQDFLSPGLSCSCWALWPEALPLLPLVGSFVCPFSLQSFLNFSSIFVPWEMKSKSEFSSNAWYGLATLGELRVYPTKQQFQTEPVSFFSPGCFLGGDAEDSS